MTKWMKQEPRRGGLRAGRGADVRVHVIKNAPNLSISAVLADGMASADRYSDGNGKLAWALRADKGGAFAVWPQTKGSSRRVASIPAEMVRGIPAGSYDVPTWIEDGKIVVDFAALRARAGV